MSEVTGIVCAHCGEITKVSNSPNADNNGTLELVESEVVRPFIMFTCKHCKAHYRLYPKF